MASLIIAGAIIGFTTAAGATATLLPDTIGYYWNTSTWYTLTCRSPEEYTTSAEVGKCCDPQTPCSMVDFCSDGTVFFSNDDYFTCYSSEHCATQTVYDSPDESSSVLNIGCATSLLANVLYRRTTTPTSTTSATTSTYSSSATPSHSITATPGQSITASAPTATTATKSSSSSSPPPRLGDSDSDSGSQAWIAGAVIGPVAGCAILAGLGFWLFRRRRTKMRAGAEAAAPITAVAGDYGLKSGGEGPSELPVSSERERPISELPGPPHYELAAD